MEDQNSPTVRLKEGINLNDLISGKGVTFEIDLDDLSRNQMPEEQPSYDREDVVQHLNFECCGLDNDEDYRGIEPFERLANKMKNVLDNGKIKKLLIQEGYGDVVPDNGEVTIDYDAYLEYNEEPFDSTYLRRRPFKFQFNEGGTIIGLEISVKTMKINEKAQFLIDSDYAYGDLGCLPRIPPKATVLFEIVLKNYVDIAVGMSSLQLNEDDDSFEEIHKYALVLCSKAKELFSRGLLWPAIKEYNMAVNKLERCRLKDQQEEKQQQDLLLRLYSNLVLCYTKVQEPRRACKNYNKVSEMCKGTGLKISSKVFFNHARSLIQLGDFNFARKQLKKAQKLEPCNITITREFMKLEELAKKNYNREMIIAKSLFVNTEVNKEPDDTSKVTKEFETSMTQFCLDLLSDKDNVRYSLPDNLVEEEFQFIKKEVTKHGLKFESYTGKSDNKKYFFVTKPSNAENGIGIA